jgi:three-Cys-motif partner protein
LGKTIKLKRRRRQKTKTKQKTVSPPPSLPPQTELALELPEGPPPEPEIPALSDPIWTENKAKLIERYLFYFVMITKHGTYIDGFAGPQEPDKPSMWAAKLVLESEPRWFRHFYFFDKGQKQIESLERLSDSQATDPTRQINVIAGDFNVEIKRVLNGRPVKESEACFCLLDQRTFECEWETLRYLARYKSIGNKIELFYFLPMHWFGRALAALGDKTPVELWWGRDDWETLFRINGDQRKELIVKRFKEELGYHSVKPWPIYEKKDGGAVMYYMIHATDHPLAPGLMARAYKKAVSPREPIEQLRLELGLRVET